MQYLVMPLPHLRRLFLLAACSALLAPLPAQTLRVMTFNVRYPAADDGDNRWERRADLFAEAIRACDPDLIGTQELFDSQAKDIVARLPEYEWFGLSRRGNSVDEHMGIFFRASRLRVVESGHFWLSETPDTPASLAWGANLPRMVTWALFEMQGSLRRFYHFNTHFAHRREDETARRNSASLIIERAAKLPAQVPFLLTGDFNAPADGPVHHQFSALWSDAWAAAPYRFGPEGTFHGFSGRSDGARIDWIFTRGGWRALQAQTVTLNSNGRYPSDHFPVFAVLELPR